MMLKRFDPKPSGEYTLTEMLEIIQAVTSSFVDRLDFLEKEVALLKEVVISHTLIDK